MRTQHIMLTLLFLTSMMYALTSSGGYAHAASLEMNGQKTVSILLTGDAQVRETYTLSKDAFTVFKQLYPDSNSLTRLFKPVYTPDQYDNVQVNEYDGNYSLAASYTLQGFAVNHGSYWSFDASVSPGVSPTLSSQTGHVLVFTWPVDSSGTLSGSVTATVEFPSQASGIKYDSSSDTVTYVLAAPAQTANLPFLQGGFGTIALAAGLALLIIGVAVFILGRLTRVKKPLLVPGPSSSPDLGQPPAPVAGP